MYDFYFPERLIYYFAQYPAHSHKKNEGNNNFSILFENAGSQQLNGIAAVCFRYSDRILNDAVKEKH